MKKTLCSQQAICKFERLSLSKLGQVQNLSCENEFNLHGNKKSFHTKVFTLTLALKQRLGATGKMASLSL